MTVRPTRAGAVVELAGPSSYYAPEKARSGGRRVPARAIAIAGEILLALSMAKPTATGGCGNAGQSPCSAGSGLAVVGMFAGLSCGILATVPGAGVVGSAGLFAAVGAGGVATGFGDDPAMHTLGCVFGGGLLSIAILVVVGAVWFRHAASSRQATRARLLATWERGTATVTSVRDTGLRINHDPRVEIVLRIEPDRGGGALERTTTTVVSRMKIPRTGDGMRVIFDRSLPARVVLEDSRA